MDNFSERPVLSSPRIFFRARPQPKRHWGWGVVTWTTQIMERNVPGRRPGAIGALMDEYERACTDLVRSLGGVLESGFARVVDPLTKDDDCRSIQTIAGHVLASGYGYADYIRDAFGMHRNSPERYLPSVESFPEALQAMLEYTATTLQD